MFHRYIYRTCVTVCFSDALRPDILVCLNVKYLYPIPAFFSLGSFLERCAIS